MGWKKGQSGNPGGKVKAPLEIIAFLREKSIWAARMLVEMVEEPKVSEGTKYKCLELILAYGLGKPKQAVTMTGTIETVDAGGARAEISGAIARLAARESEERDSRTLN